MTNLLHPSLYRCKISVRAIPIIRSKARSSYFIPKSILVELDQYMVEAKYLNKRLVQTLNAPDAFEKGILRSDTSKLWLIDE